MDGTSILSQEGTTQGDPLAIPLYALSTVPLIKELSSLTDTKQVWYADDSAAIGSILSIKEWWDKLLTRGPPFGYHVNAAKSWLVVKEGAKQVACDLFQNSAINITTEGCPYLGAPVGSQAFIQDYVTGKVDQWSTVLSSLRNCCLIHPHSTYSIHSWDLESLAIPVSHHAEHLSSSPTS